MSAASAGAALGAVSLSEPEHPAINMAESPAPSAAQNWRRPVPVIGCHRTPGWFPTAGCRVRRDESGDVRWRLRKGGRFCGQQCETATTLSGGECKPTSTYSTTFCRSMGAIQYSCIKPEGGRRLFRFRPQLDCTHETLSIASPTTMTPDALNELDGLDRNDGVRTLVAAVFVTTCYDTM